MSKSTPADIAAALDRFTSGKDYPLENEFFEEHGCTRHEADCELLAKAFVAHRQQVAALVAEWRESAAKIKKFRIKGGLKSRPAHRAAGCASSRRRMERLDHAQEQAKAITHETYGSSHRPLSGVVPRRQR